MRRRKSGLPRRIVRGCEIAAVVLGGRYRYDGGRSPEAQASWPSEDVDSVSLITWSFTESTMPVVKFVKENKEIEVSEGSNLRTEAIKAGINPHQGLNGMGASMNKYFNCKGFGQCGTCRVNIVEGMENVTSMGMVEKLRFRCPLPTPVTPGGIDPLPCMAFVGNEDTMRLACQVKVHGDIEVETGPELDLFGENFFS